MAPSPASSSEIRWDAYPQASFSQTWSAPCFDDDSFRRGEASGLIERFSEDGFRTFVRAAGGSGTVDRVRVRPGAEVAVHNCVLPVLDRRTYDADEPILLLYASLSCDLTYHIEGQLPITLNRPEITLLSVPKGLPLTIDIQGGVPQQRLFGLFRHGALAEALGIRSDRLPPVMRDVATSGATFGRLVSLPLSHHVAGLVAEAIDTPLQGEMRALQYEGHLIELVAYALDAINRTPTGPRPALRSQRELELAFRAKERMSRDYRKPPEVDDLARELGTNSNKLRVAFKAAFGMTMAEYCLDRRMREAQQLLLKGQLGIAQIASRVGYEFPGGFTAAFSSHVGMTPREYRRHRAPINVPLGRPDTAS